MDEAMQPAAPEFPPPPLPPSFTPDEAAGRLHAFLYAQLEGTREQLMYWQARAQHFEGTATALQAALDQHRAAEADKSATRTNGQRETP